MASEVGGIPEQVVEGKTGFLVPVGDAHVMSVRILQLLADEGLRRETGILAAEGAARWFGADRMMREYIQFYRDFLLII